MNKETYITNSEQETIQCGVSFAERLIPGDVIALFGELGSGKTQFIKGICKSLHSEEIVTSPTFTIVNVYNGSQKENPVEIYHIDLYRIKNINELQEIGFNDLLNIPDGIVLIEWAEKAEGVLPETKYTIKIQSPEDDEDRRVIEIFH